MIREWQWNGSFCPGNSAPPDLREHVIKTDSFTGGCVSPQTFLQDNRDDCRHINSTQSLSKLAGSTRTLEKWYQGHYMSLHFLHCEQVSPSAHLWCRRVRKRFVCLFLFVFGFFFNILHYHWSCQQDINSPKTATESIELQRGITNAPLSVASKPLSLFTKSLKSLQLSQNIYYTVKMEKYTTFGNFYFPLLKIWEPIGLFKAA